VHKSRGSFPWGELFPPAFIWLKQATAMPKGQIPTNLVPRHPIRQPVSPAMMMPLSNGRCSTADIRPSEASFDRRARRRHAFRISAGAVNRRGLSSPFGGSYGRGLTMQISW
jgi:hypothetical protein